jgi:hypothetical protein
MPTEKQLLEQAKQLQGQTSATDEAAVTIFAALLLADTIRAVGSGISVKTIVVLRILLHFVTFSFIRIDVFSGGLSVKSGFSSINSFFHSGNPC